MNAEAAEGLISGAVGVQSIPEVDELAPPISRIVTQSYDHTPTPYGPRSTCQVASVINAARLLGYDIPDFQTEIIRNLHVPWDRGSGGISTAHSNQMAQIYRVYAYPAVVRDFVNAPLSRVLNALLEQNALTATSGGKDHSIALFGLFRHRNQNNPFSIVVDPLTGNAREIAWVDILTQSKIPVDTWPATIVHTTFLVR